MVKRAAQTMEMFVQLAHCISFGTIAQRNLPGGHFPHFDGFVSRRRNNGISRRHERDAGNIVVVPVHRLDALKTLEIPQLDSHVRRARHCNENSLLHHPCFFSMWSFNLPHRCSSLNTTHGHFSTAQNVQSPYLTTFLCDRKRNLALSRCGLSVFFRSHPFHNPTPERSSPLMSIAVPPRKTLTIGKIRQSTTHLYCSIFGSRHDDWIHRMKNDFGYRASVPAERVFFRWSGYPLGWTALFSRRPTAVEFSLCLRKFCFQVHDLKNKKATPKKRVVHRNLQRTWKAKTVQMTTNQNDIKLAYLFLQSDNRCPLLFQQTRIFVFNFSGLQHVKPGFQVLAGYTKKRRLSTESFARLLHSPCLPLSETLAVLGDSHWNSDSRQ